MVGLGLGLAIQASRVFLHRLAIHTATGKASRVYSISLYGKKTRTFHVVQTVVKHCSILFVAITDKLRQIAFVVWRQSGQVSTRDFFAYIAGFFTFITVVRRTVLNTYGVTAVCNMASARASLA